MDSCDSYGGQVAADRIATVDRIATMVDRIATVDSCEGYGGQVDRKTYLVVISVS